jgi:hypothetical protein
MQLRTLLLVLVLALTALFAAVNWGAFTAPTTLGLIMLAITATGPRLRPTSACWPRVRGAARSCGPRISVHSSPTCANATSR